MKYVHTNEVVYDSISLAFPGLGNCQGFVYVTETGMFGYHAMGNPQNSYHKHNAFGHFVKNHSQGNTKGICLYGLCPDNRYKPGVEDQEHKTELKVVADSLKYSGKTIIHRWKTPNDWNSAYVECRFHQKSLSVYFAHWPRGTHGTTGANPSTYDHKAIASGGGVSKSAEDVNYIKVSHIGNVVTGVPPFQLAQVQPRRLWNFW